MIASSQRDALVVRLRREYISLCGAVSHSQRPFTRHVVRSDEAACHLLRSKSAEAFCIAEGEADLHAGLAGIAGAWLGNVMSTAVISCMGTGGAGSSGAGTTLVVQAKRGPKKGN